MQNKTGLRLVDVAQNPANGFPARLLALLCPRPLPCVENLLCTGEDAVPAEKRKQLNIGISQDQYEMIKTAAEQEGLTVTAFRMPTCQDS